MSRAAGATLAGVDRPPARRRGLLLATLLLYGLPAARPAAGEPAAPPAGAATAADAAADAAAAPATPAAPAAKEGPALDATADAADAAAAPATPAAPAAKEGPALDATDCVRLALAGSAKIDEAQAKIRGFEARLAEVESVFYPKLMGMAYIAPMFTVHGDAMMPDVRRDYSPGAWGPYTHLQAMLAQPLYTFGRAEAGKEAASQRLEVERARLHEVRNALALEVRKLYYLRLMALSLLPPLEAATKTLEQAQEKAREMYDQGTGQVTQVDLEKLGYGAAELARYRVMAEDGAKLALQALKHTMGLQEDYPLVLADQTLPPPPPGPDPALHELLAEAARQRPEWAKIDHGLKAAGALARAERAADRPVLFLGGQLGLDWAPTRPDAKNPFHYDPYNGVSGGVALGLMFDIDPAKSRAKARQAEALQDEVEALSRFAATGIPLQVRKALQDVGTQRAMLEQMRKAVQSTRKWMAFAATGYLVGTGEAKDLLEGLVAHLQARRSYYEGLRALHQAFAELDHAVGRDVAAAAAD